MAKNEIAGKEYGRRKKGLGHKLVKVIVIYAGMRAVIKTGKYLAEKYLPQGKEHQTGDKLDYNLICNGKEVKIEQEVFKGGDVNSIFSSLKLDLSNAIIEEDTDINVNSLMSGISILVPDHIKVDVSSKNIASGIANHVPYVEEETAPTIHIKVSSIMSGIEVKIKEIENESTDETACSEAEAEVSATEENQSEEQ